MLEAFCRSVHLNLAFRFGFCIILSVISVRLLGFFVVGQEDVMFPGHRLRVVFVFLAVALSFWITAAVVGHAVLVESSPALKSSVAGPDVPLKLRFNVRIDAARSRLTLVDPDGASQTLEISKQDSPEIISAEAKGLQAGLYRLRWQVLASDGHITRGEIPFTVVRP